MEFRYCAIAFLSLLLSCSKRASTDQPPVATDTTESTESVTTPAKAVDIEVPDSLAYIGYVYKFDESEDFYVDLYFKDGFNYDEYDRLKSLGEERIYQDGELKRRTIPTEEARKYFLLSGLGKINVYNKTHRVVATGKLKAIEYTEDFLEGKFVGVFKLDNPSITDYSFCIGGLKQWVDPLEYAAYSDEVLTEQVAQHLGLDTEKIFGGKQYSLNESGAIYTVLSSDTSSYIVESLNDTRTLLYRSESSESIFDLQIIPKTVNGKPILLVACGVPETDMLWASLLVFNGTKYKVTRNNIRLE